MVDTVCKPGLEVSGVAPAGVLNGEAEQNAPIAARSESVAAAGRGVAAANSTVARPHSASLPQLHGLHDEQRPRVYQVTLDERSQPQIEALPPAAGAAFAEARVLLEVSP
jgi:hypothetical protein